MFKQFGALLLTQINLNLIADKWLHPYKVWDEIMFPLPNFNCAAIEVWGWISNFIPCVTGYVITYLCCLVLLDVLVSSGEVLSLIDEFKKVTIGPLLNNTYIEIS